jgi:hypothetical protein
MKEKVKAFLLKVKTGFVSLLTKAYANVWFNTFCVALGSIFGLIQAWPVIVFIMLYGVGAVVVYKNAPITPVKVKRSTKKM